MTKRVQRFGLVSATLAVTIGLARELIMDLTNGTITLHDGATSGGIPMARKDLGNVAVATGAANGVMSAADKTKLDAVAAGATNTPLSNTVALALGSASAGVSSSAARVDHVHPLLAVVLNDYISKLGLSNDGSTPNTILDIAAGICADSTNAVMITGTAFTKKTGGAWVAGTAQNGMGNGLTIAGSTWYHVFAIINNGAYDVYFDTSITAANKPVSTTAFRRIGSFKTDSSVHILSFTQAGQRITWKSPITDINTGTPQTASFANLVVSVPIDLSVQPIFNILYTGANLGGSLNLNDGSQTGTTQFNVGRQAVTSGSGFYGMISDMRTNTSAQIQYFCSTGSDGLNITTLGWYDTTLSAS